MGFSKRTIQLIMVYFSNKRIVDVPGTVYGDDPVVGYCKTIDGTKYSYSIIHLATKATMTGCTSIERARRIIKDLEENHREVLEFTKIPGKKKQKELGKQLAHIKEWRGIPKEND